jgi:hypothetical protein
MPNSRDKKCGEIVKRVPRSRFPPSTPIQQQGLFGVEAVAVAFTGLEQCGRSFMEGMM